MNQLILNFPDAVVYLAIVAIVLVHIKCQSCCAYFQQSLEIGRYWFDFTDEKPGFMLMKKLGGSDMASELWNCHGYLALPDFRASTPSSTPSSTYLPFDSCACVLDDQVCLFKFLPY